MFKQDVQGYYSESIGLGLFIRKRLLKNQAVTKFVGEIITEVEYKKRYDRGRHGYAIRVRDGCILDCFKFAKKLLCFASYANSPYNVMTQTGKVLTANCIICVHPQKIEQVTLRVKANVVEPGTELLWNYGNSFKIF